MILTVTRYIDDDFEILLTDGQVVMGKMLLPAECMNALDATIGSMLHQTDLFVVSRMIPYPIPKPRVTSHESPVT